MPKGRGAQSLSECQQSMGAPPIHTLTFTGDWTWMEIYFRTLLDSFSSPSSEDWSLH